MPLTPGPSLFTPTLLWSPGLEALLAERASRRNLSDLTVGPVLTWTTEAMQSHMEKVLAIPGA